MSNKVFRRSVILLTAVVCIILLVLSVFMPTKSESSLAEPFMQDLRIDAQDLEINGWIEVPDTLIVGTGHYQIISPGEYIIIDANLNTVTMTAPIGLWRVTEGE